MAKTKNHTLAFQLTVDTKNFTSGMNLSKKEIQQAKREMTGLLTPAEKMEVKLHKLGELAKKDAKFQSTYNEALKRSQKQMAATAKAAKGLGGSIAAMAGSYLTFQGALRTFRAFDEQIDILDALGKQADRTGASVEFLSRTQFIAGKTAGMSAEETAKAMDEMAKKLGRAATGTGTAFVALRDQLGMTRAEIREIAKLNTDEKFEAIRNAVRGVGDETRRMAIANEIFGRSGAKISSVLGLQNDAYKEQIRLAERLGVVRTKAQTDQAQKTRDDLDEAYAAIENLKAELAIAAAPTASAYAKTLQGRGGFGQMLGGLGQFARGDFAGGITTSVGGARKIDEAYLGKALQYSQTGKDLKRSAEELAKIQESLKAAADEVKNKSDKAQAKTLAKGISFSINEIINRTGKGVKSLNLQERLANIHIRKPQEEISPRFEMQARRGMTGPMASAGAGSSAAFRLLNQTATVQSVEVQMAKTRTEKAVETVTVLEQMKELMAKNHWQQKEYNEQQDEK